MHFASCIYASYIMIIPCFVLIQLSLNFSLRFCKMMSFMWKAGDVIGVNMWQSWSVLMIRHHMCLRRLDTQTNWLSHASYNGLDKCYLLDILLMLFKWFLRSTKRLPYQLFMYSYSISFKQAFNNTRYLKSEYTQLPKYLPAASRVM